MELLRISHKFSAKCLLMFSLMLGTAFASEPLPDSFIQLDSERGTVLLKEVATPDTVKLLSHFTTQDTQTYCGVATAVMVLNSMGVSAPVDPDYAPYAYFTQHDFFNNKMNIKPDNVKKVGMTLSEIAQAISTYGVQATAYPANKMTLDEFREKASKALSAGEFVTINFLRSAMHQDGGGHHSPLAAYDKSTDRFLILDVTRYVYPAYWVKTADIWSGINTMDDANSRGFVVIKK